MRRVTPFLAARDLAETIRFYTDLLGFTVEVADPEDKPTFVLLECGGAAVIFDSTLWRDPPVMTSQLHFDLGPALDADSPVNALHERISDQVEVLWGPEVFDYGRREFSCTDPNGYALVFSEQVTSPPG